MASRPTSEGRGGTADSGVLDALNGDAEPVTDQEADSQLRFLDVEGRVLPGPSEWSPHFIEVPGDEKTWSETRVSLNGQRVEVVRRRLGGEVRTVAEWPRCDPGGFRLWCKTAEGTWTQTISVEPSKITTEQFAQLLEDLETRFPTSVAIRLQRLGALSGLKQITPEASSIPEELERLRRAVHGTASRAGLAAVLRSLRWGHHRVLRQHHLWLRREKARRPAPARLVEALRWGSNLDMHDSFPAGVLPRRVPDARSEHTADVYENRLVRAFSTEVGLRLRWLVRFVGQSAPTDLAQELSDLIAELEAARRQAAFLNEVGELKQAPNRVTMVLMKRPEYRDALAGYQELHRSLRVIHRDQRLEVRLRDLPVLYQLWGTLVVIDAVLELAEELGLELEHQALVQPIRGSAFLKILPDGREAIRLSDGSSSTTVRVFPERSYRRGSWPYQSCTYTQRPDIAIEITRPGAAAKVLVLDPKYKLWSEQMTGLDPKGRPKKEDIDKMHAYRDAIRDARGRRVVRYAAILYPGATRRYRGGLGAFRSVPGAERELVDTVKDLLRRQLSAETVSPDHRAAQS